MSARKEQNVEFWLGGGVWGVSGKVLLASRSQARTDVKRRVGETSPMRVRAGSRMFSRNKKSTCKAWRLEGAWRNTKQGSREVHNEKTSTRHEAGSGAGQTRPELPCSLVTIQRINKEDRTGIGQSFIQHTCWTLICQECQGPRESGMKKTDENSCSQGIYTLMREDWL